MRDLCYRTRENGNVSASAFPPTPHRASIKLKASNEIEKLLAATTFSRPFSCSFYAPCELPRSFFFQDFGPAAFVSKDGQNSLWRFSFVVFLLYLEKSFPSNGISLAVGEDYSSESAAKANSGLNDQAYTRLRLHTHCFMLVPWMNEPLGGGFLVDTCRSRYV